MAGPSAKKLSLSGTGAVHPSTKPWCEGGQSRSAPASSGKVPGRGLRGDICAFCAKWTWGTGGRREKSAGGYYSGLVSRWIGGVVPGRVSEGPSGRIACLGKFFGRRGAHVLHGTLHVRCRDRRRCPSDTGNSPVQDHASGAKE